jgi:hypothetical protein
MGDCLDADAEYWLKTADMVITWAIRSLTEYAEKNQKTLWALRDNKKMLTIKQISDDRN